MRVAVDGKFAPEFDRTLGDETHTGTLSVADGILTLKVEGGETELRPIVPLEDAGKLVGYELTDEATPIEWLKPRAAVPGQIPVGAWAIY